jgi:hypothetical protein
VKDELKVVEAAINSQLQDLENKVAGDDSTLQQRLQIAFDKTNVKFLDQFEQMVADYQKQIAKFDAENS